MMLDPPSAIFANMAGLDVRYASALAVFAPMPLASASEIRAQFALGFSHALK